MTGGLAAMVFAAVGPVVGILENPQCKPDTPRSVRVLFEKQASGWVSLATPKAAPADLTSQWTVAFDGRSLGTLVTTDPGWHSEYAWTYPRDRLLAVTGHDMPTVPNRSRGFGGWCDPPTMRPLVVVSRPNFSDPARWKPSQPPAALLTRLFPEFRARAGRVSTCPSDPEAPADFDYSINDLRLITGYADGQGRRLAAVSLDSKLDTCDGPTQAAWLPNWYFVAEGGKSLLFIGNGLSMIDAGDYDADGNSEVLFWYSGYDEDGYILFADAFATRVPYLWSYH